MVWPTLGSRTAKEQNRTAASPQVPKSIVAKREFRHFRSSEQHADDTNRLARYDFLLVFYND